MNPRNDHPEPLADWELELLYGDKINLAIRARINERINRLTNDNNALKARIGTFVADGFSLSHAGITEAVERIKINRLIIAELSLF